MLLNTIVKSIKRKSHRGDQAVTTDQITADIVACISESYREVIRMLPKRFLHTKGTALPVTAGTMGVPHILSLASDCQEPIYFHYNAPAVTYRKLTKIQSDHEWLDQIWSPIQGTMAPAFFREIGPDTSGNKQIEIFPIPSFDFDLNYEYYKRHPTDLTVADLNSEIPLLPDLYQDTVEKGGLYIFLKGFDDSMAAVAKADYQEAKLALEAGDEQDLDADISFRFPTLGISPYNTARFDTNK